MSVVMKQKRLNNLNKWKQTQLIGLEQEEQDPNNPIVNRTVGGKIVPCHWNDLFEWERRAARVAMDNPCGLA